jgi:hypothetical protein
VKVIKVANGNHYVTRSKRPYLRTWFLVKALGKQTGFIEVRDVYFPKEFIGKRVMFKVEVLK